MEGTLWQKGRLSYEKRHFCVEEDENGELCLVGRIKTREGKVDNSCCWPRSSRWMSWMSKRTSSLWKRGA